MQKTIHVLTVGFVFFFIGCASSPSTVKQQSQETSTLVTIENILPPSAEKHIGQLLWHEILAKYPLYYQPELSSYLQEVGSHVSIATMRKGVAYHFYVVDSAEVFSLGLPGGDILLSRGLLQKIHTESELAAVLGTEIAAVERQYFLRLLQKADANSSLAKDFIQNPKKIKQSYTFLRNNRFTDTHINEADLLGMTYAQHFGYTPEDFHQLLERLSTWQGKQDVVGTDKYNYDTLDHRRSMSQVFVDKLTPHQKKFKPAKNRYGKYKKLL